MLVRPDGLNALRFKRLSILLVLGDFADQYPCMFYELLKVAEQQPSSFRHFRIFLQRLEFVLNPVNRFAGIIQLAFDRRPGGEEEHH